MMLNLLINDLINSFNYFQNNFPFRSFFIYFFYFTKPNQTNVLFLFTFFILQNQTKQNKTKDYKN